MIVVMKIGQEHRANDFLHKCSTWQNSRALCAMNKVVKIFLFVSQFGLLVLVSSIYIISPLQKESQLRQPEIRANTTNNNVSIR